MRTDAPALVDLVAAGAAAEQEDGASDAQLDKGAKRKRVYEDHRLMSDITAGIKRGIYHQACCAYFQPHLPASQADKSSPWNPTAIQVVSFRTGLPRSEGMMTHCTARRCWHGSPSHDTPSSCTSKTA